MGNQLTGIVPSQILPVEHYLQEVKNFEYEASLGSTRFFKVCFFTAGDLRRLLLIHQLCFLPIPDTRGWVLLSRGF